MKRFLCSLVFCVLCLSAGGAFAEVPPTIHYQGFLTDGVGAPMTGTFEMSFSFFDELEGGKSFFSEVQQVHVKKGGFFIILGEQSGNPLAPETFSSGQVYLEIAVRIKDQPNTVLSPRQHLSSYPYAMWTETAGVCAVAESAMGMGGVPAASYVKKDELAAQGLTAGFVTTEYLEDNKYVTEDQLPGMLSGEGLLDLIAESGLVLMADGSVKAAGNLNMDSHEIMNLVMHNAASNSTPANPKEGQLWYDTTEHKPKIWNGVAWEVFGTGGSFNPISCNACIGPQNVNIPFAASASKGGAALSSMDLSCSNCVGEGELDVSWARSDLPGGDALAAKAVHCNGCVASAQLADAAKSAAGISFNPIGTGLTATNVQEALNFLVTAGPGGVAEGNGTMSSSSDEWEMEQGDTVRHWVHLLNPSTPKVLAYLYGESSPRKKSVYNVTVYGDTPVNRYVSNVSGLALSDFVVTSDASALTPGDVVLIYQTVGIGGTGEGAGKWEINRVKSVDVAGSKVFMTHALKNTYEDGGPASGQVQMVIAENYSTLTVESTGRIRPSKALDGNADSGGIVFIQAETVRIKNGGIIHADAYGFDSGGDIKDAGDSECNANKGDSTAANCSGGGGAGGANCGGGGGGGKTAGVAGTDGGCSGAFGKGGTVKVGATSDRLHMGGGAGQSFATFNTNLEGNGGGLVIIGAKTIDIGTAGRISANGGAAVQSNCGGGAGGAVMLFGDTIVGDTAGVQVNGGAGKDRGGAGGTGFYYKAATTSLLRGVAYPSGIKIAVDGKDVTSSIGNPNNKALPNWNEGEQSWGGPGGTEWSSGPLDLSSATLWTTGEHKVELTQAGPGTGKVQLYTYVVYPFSKSVPPLNDTCANPEKLDVMTTGVAFAYGTTEDIMGKIKAKDNYVQPLCGGSGGADVVYEINLTDWRKLVIDVNAPFDTRLYLRRTNCENGLSAGCGVNSLVTSDLKTGKYYLFIDADGNLRKGDFTVTVQASVPLPPENDNCTNPMTLKFDETGTAEIYGVTLFSKNDYTLCGGAPGNDNVYKFVVPAGAQSFQVEIDCAFNSMMYLSNNACATEPLIACIPVKTYPFPFPAPGTYFLIVDGQTALDKGEYTLTVTIK